MFTFLKRKTVDPDPDAPILPPLTDPMLNNKDLIIGECHPEVVVHLHLCHGSLIVLQNYIFIITFTLISLIIPLLINAINPLFDYGV